MADMLNTSIDGAKSETDSVARWARARGVELVSRTSVDRNPKMNDDAWARGASHFVVVLRLQGRCLVTYFSTGSGKLPTLSDVLGCLQCDLSCDFETFEEYCGEFGADPDSRRAFAAWERLRDANAETRRFLGSHADEFLACEVP